jgi:hypothetical protein
MEKDVLSKEKKGMRKECAAGNGNLKGNKYRKYLQNNCL